MLDILSVQNGNGVTIGDSHDAAFQGCGGHWQREEEKQGGKDFHGFRLNWRQTFKSTSAIRAAPGSAEQMKIRMGYYDNTSLIELT